MCRYHIHIMLIVLLLMLTVMPSWLGAQDTDTSITIPPPVALGDENGYDIEHILLLGSDTDNPRNSGRTDVILIVSVNYSENTVALLSIPRDLYVYIPSVGMQRINTAFAFGEQAQPGTGPQLLSDTILYNLGLGIDHYARVDFNGFRQLVDDLGGIEISVDCAIQDWRLREPDLDRQVEDNWELFTLPVGVHRLDGELALWYARSRRTSSDYDRGRRHQAILRAMLARIRTLGLLEQLRDVWPQVGEVVQTDLAFDDILRLTAAAGQMQSDRMASYMLRPNVEAHSWRAPDGASVQVPNREAIEALIARFLAPPTRLQIGREHPRIEIVNASGVQSLARVAADRLAWEGFLVDIAEQPAQYQYATTIVDFTAQTKGSSLALVQAIMRVTPENIVTEPQPTRTVDFRITLGGAYQSCTYDVMPPREVEDTEGVSS